MKWLNKVTVYDYTDYKSETSRNGGDYGFCETYTRISDDAFEVSYGTTAEFDYCPCCGSFYQGKCSCGFPDEENYYTVSLNELIDTIKRAENDDAFIVKCECERKVL